MEEIRLSSWIVENGSINSKQISKCIWQFMIIIFIHKLCEMEKIYVMNFQYFIVIEHRIRASEETFIE